MGQFPDEHSQHIGGDIREGNSFRACLDLSQKRGTEPQNAGRKYPSKTSLTIVFLLLSLPIVSISSEREARIYQMNNY